MLLTNYSFINNLNGHNHSGITNPLQWIRPHVMRGYYTYSDVGPNTQQIQRDNFSTGTYPPYCIVLSDKGGLISASNTVIGNVDFNNINLAGGLNGEGEWDGTGTISGELGALSFLISTLSSSGDVTADIQAAVSIASDLAGQGDVEGALGSLINILSDLNGEGELSGSIAGALSAAANLSSQGDISGSIKAVVEILSDILGTNALTSSIIGNWEMAVNIANSGTILSDITALAHILSDMTGTNTTALNSGSTPGTLSANISSTSELSPENLAAAVWNSIAASFNSNGSMGNKLNSAASAGDPWSTALPGSYVEGEAGKILDQIRILMEELHKLRGLKQGSPVQVSSTKVEVDDIEIAVSTDGGVTTMERQ